MTADSEDDIDMRLLLNHGKATWCPHYTDARYQVKKEKMYTQYNNLKTMIRGFRAQYTVLNCMLLVYSKLWQRESLKDHGLP